MTLKIAIIAHNCRAGGCMIITHHLLRSMLAISDLHDYFVVYSKGYGYEEIINRSNCRTFCFDKPQNAFHRGYFESLVLPRIINDCRPDVIFGPGNIGLRRPSCPQALLIHHAYLYHTSKHYPRIEFRDRLRIWAFQRQVKSCLPSTQKIMVQTPIVQKRFSDHCNYPAERIKVVRFPVPVDINPDSNCPVPSPLEGCRACFKILFLTRYMAHRNPEILLPLCQQYGEQLRRAGVCFITAIGSHQKGRAELFLKRVHEYGMGDLVVNVGELSRPQVVQYYTHCDALWLHTLMETLCLPFLEAMTMGVPILSPDFDFSRYVCGNAALYYDPWDIRSLYEKIICLKENSDLRKQLVADGYREIKMSDKFSSSWEETAKDVLDNLREISNK
ncbi:MAG: glycosyltransferase [Planctomycetales bacterium]|nr:glycosyltransferase [Planctomycetales bacterium]